MALPTLDHTWRFKVNQSIATSGNTQTDNRNRLLAIKNSLITAAGWTDSTGGAATLSTPWTVTASSDGTTADGNDNWAAAGNLVWNTAGNAHSWIILRQTAINGQNFELCIDLNAGYQAYLSLIISLENGFNVSSPSILNRPTSSDEVVFLSANQWGTTGAENALINVCCSDDGHCTRIWAYYTNILKTYWQFDKPKNTVTGWTYPASATILSNNIPSFDNLNAYGYNAFANRIKATNTFGETIIGKCYYSTELYYYGTVGQRQTTVNSLTSEWPFNRIGLLCITAGLCGRHGELSDIWFGSVTPANADCYPAAGTIRQFVQVYDLILTWNQSVPLTA